MSCMRALFWCLILLLLIMFMFAICILQVVSMKLTEIRNNPDLEFALDEDELKDFFGSLPLCIYTLHMAITGGVDWGAVAGTLAGVHHLMLFLYVTYISFSLWCVLNIITGVFVENANRITTDEEALILQEVAAREEWFSEVKVLFHKLDIDESGSLDWPEFERIIRDVRVQKVFSDVGVDLSHV